MKKTQIIFLLLFLFSCSKKIHILDEIQPIYWKSILSSGIEIKNEWAYPSDRKNSFQINKDEWVYCLVELKNLNSVHSLSWAWFNSKGELYRKSPEIKIEAGENKKNIVAWDKISLSEELEKGRWWVVIFFDGKSVDKKEFEIK